MAIEKVTVPVARKIAGLTQTELGQKVGVSGDTVSNWERGITEPTVTQAQAIADAVGLDFDDIIFLPQITV